MPAPIFTVGDTFTMGVPVSRKWWQLWKPRVSQVMHTFTITENCTMGSFTPFDMNAPRVVTIFPENAKGDA